MTPHDVLVPQVPDDQLGGLLTDLSQRGLTPRLVDGSTLPAALDPADPDLPAHWTPVEDREPESYTWPDGNVERYHRYRVYVGRTAGEGRVHIAIGHAERASVFGRERRYRILFLGDSSPVRPLVEFLEVDDHDSTGDLIAVIRGSDGGKKMYDPGAKLPPAYDQLGGSIVVFRDRIPQRNAWNKLALVANESDVVTQLNHALLQARRRGDLQRSRHRA